MDLHLDPRLAVGYHSKSQSARVMTEGWFEQNVYCPACPSEELTKLPDNMKVLDFQCPSCEETFQLKSTSGIFGSTVVDSEYNTKIKQIRSGLSPNWSFLQYNAKGLTVRSLMMIPKHFMTLDAIQRRTPLRESARRAGWVGSNILLGRLPPDARVFLVRDGEVTLPGSVRAEWRRFAFLEEEQLEGRGWLNDVLTCVRDLGKREFTLEEVYGYEPRLQALHRNNRHVRPKIRQQLQVLRDHGIIEFMKPGSYRIRGP